MQFQSFILSLFLIVNNIDAQQYPGDSCITKKDSTNGICKLVDQCEDALNEIKAKRRHSHSRCGFEGSTEVVCCAAVVSKFGGDKTVNNAIKIAESECEKIEIYLVTHIIGGTEVRLGEFPHSVALAYRKDDGTYKFDCGGTIISQNFVLTAGHCVLTADNAVPAFVRAGIVDLGPNTYQPETDYMVEEIIKHPNYTRSSKYNDIALLRLEKPFTFSSTLNAACLETNTEVSRVPLEVSGWGLISNTKYLTSPVLLKTSVKPVSSTDCAPYYKELRKMSRGIVDGQFCAGDDQGGHDTCQGDSGGPATITTPEGKFKLVGVTSFGRGCGSTVPAIYTRVAHYIDWIVANVWPSQLRNSV